jgi:hypothetical protein
MQNSIIESFIHKVDLFLNEKPNRISCFLVGTELAIRINNIIKMRCLANVHSFNQSEKR